MDQKLHNPNLSSTILLDFDDFTDSYLTITAAISALLLISMIFGIYLIIRCRKNRSKLSSNTDSLLLNPNTHTPTVSIQDPHSKPEPPSPPISQPAPKTNTINPPLFQIPPVHGYITSNNYYNIPK